MLRRGVNSYSHLKEQSVLQLPSACHYQKRYQHGRSSPVRFNQVRDFDSAIESRTIWADTAGKTRWGEQGQGSCRQRRW